MKISKRDRRTTFNLFIKEAIRRGIIDPRGKGDTELAQAAEEWLLSWPDDVRIVVAIDHRGDLLSQARGFIRTRQYHLGCLLLATWTEHWVNAIVDARCRTMRIPDDERKDLIRSVSLVGKCSWLFRLLGTTSIPRAHLDRIRNLAELRNAFVHYKWQSQDTDEGHTFQKEKALLARALSDFDKSIKYLQKYETKRLLHGSSRRISRIGSKRTE
jgi:hypothetical protein